MDMRGSITLSGGQNYAFIETRFLKLNIEVDG